MAIGSILGALQGDETITVKSGSAVGNAAVADAAGVLTATEFAATNAALTNAAITNASLSTTLTIANAGNIALGTGSGTMIGTANNQKLGHFGVTPVIQPATATQTVGEAGLVANNSASSVYVTNTSNFNGNSGSTAYTVNALVRALKDLGLIKV